MNTTVTKLIVAGLLFFFTLLSGIWVSHSGKPINGVAFTIHKLIALAATIVIGISIYTLFKTLDQRSWIVLAVIATTGLLFIVLFITGALLSRNTPLPIAILRIHQGAPLLALISSTIILYLLNSGKF